MTREEIMSLQGRKLDEAVAERVLCQPGKPVPPYSTSIDHLVQGDWTTVDGRKLCSLCAYYAYGEGK